MGASAATVYTAAAATATVYTAADAAAAVYTAAAAVAIINNDDSAISLSPLLSLQHIRVKTREKKRFSPWISELTRCHKNLGF